MVRQSGRKSGRPNRARLRLATAGRRWSWIRPHPRGRLDHRRAILLVGGAARPPLSADASQTANRCQRCQMAMAKKRDPIADSAWRAILGRSLRAGRLECPDRSPPYVKNAEPNRIGAVFGFAGQAARAPRFVDARRRRAARAGYSFATPDRRPGPRVGTDCTNRGIRPVASHIYLINQYVVHRLLLV